MTDQLIHQSVASLCIGPEEQQDVRVAAERPQQIYTFGLEWKPSDKEKISGEALREAENPPCLTATRRTGNSSGCA